MNEHTPGPWHISKSGLYIRKNDGPNWPPWNICEMNLDHDRGEANAHLIAAAPDLLAACEATYDWIARIGNQAPLTRADKVGPMNQLRAATCRARGLDRTE